MKKYSKKQMIGIVLKTLLVLFFMFDSITKIIKHPESIKGSAVLGVPETLVPTVGVLLLSFTIVYAIPKLAKLGALLLTAFLGAATSVMILASMPGHPYFFPIVICTLVWLSQELISANVVTYFFKKGPTASA